MSPDDFVDKDQLRVDRFFRQLGLRILKHSEEERELVRVFFGDMVASGPLWLVPGLLQFVVRKAALTELQISRRIAGTIPIDDLPY